MWNMWLLVNKATNCKQFLRRFQGKLSCEKKKKKRIAAHNGRSYSKKPGWSPSILRRCISFIYEYVKSAGLPSASNFSLCSLKYCTYLLRPSQRNHPKKQAGRTVYSTRDMVTAKYQPWRQSHRQRKTSHKLNSSIKFFIVVSKQISLRLKWEAKSCCHHWDDF